MKKKIVALGLVVALSVSSLTGCSFNSKTPVISIATNVVKIFVILAG